jgi:hypothetical protein
MNRRCLLGCGMAVWLLAAGPARAHFLFLHIGPPAEAGRSAEVFFSDHADAGDPKFVGKIAHTQLWLQEASGELRPLTVRQGTDRLRATLPAAGSVVVVGRCEYGVLARPGQTPFLLRYYPKGMAGDPAELKRRPACGKTPVEIMGVVEGDEVRLTVLRDGKPVPGAELRTVDVKLDNEKLVAGSDGQAVWRPKAPGRYAVYAHVTTPTAGEQAGKKYAEVREYATLAFAWPLGQKGAEPEAAALFEDAVAARAQWKGFPGFRARIRGEVDGRAFEGNVTVDRSGEVRLEAGEGPAVEWVKEQLESMAMHRGAGSSGGGGSGPKPAFRFADAEEGNPLGRLLVSEGGRSVASYRVKDRQILVVNRYGKQNMTITVLDNERNPDGKFLPRSYTVQYWDGQTGALRRVEAIQERWQRVGSWDLPTVHTVTSAGDGGLAVRSFTLAEHRLLGEAP